MARRYVNLNWKWSIVALHTTNISIRSYYKLTPNRTHIANPQTSHDQNET